MNRNKMAVIIRNAIVIMFPCLQWKSTQLLEIIKDSLKIEATQDAEDERERPS